MWNKTLIDDRIMTTHTHTRCSHPHHKAYKSLQGWRNESTHDHINQQTIVNNDTYAINVM